MNPWCVARYLLEISQSMNQSIVPMRAQPHRPRHGIAGTGSHRLHCCQHGWRHFTALKYVIIIIICRQHVNNMVMLWSQR